MTRAGQMPSLKATLSILLIFSFVLSTGFSGYARAALVTTDSVVAEQSVEADREKIAATLAREDVKEELKAYGIEPQEAAARLAALSDSEVRKLADKLDREPAGQGAAESLIGAALVVFVVLLVTDIFCVTDVFGFTRCVDD